MSNICLRCGYSITEPICDVCVINEIKIWLNEQPLKSNAIKKINNELNHLLKQIESIDYVSFPSKDIWVESVMRCIRCNKDMHLMCFYCVNNQASKIVNSYLRNEILIESFHDSFNTDLYDYSISKISSNTY